MKFSYTLLITLLVVTFSLSVNTSIAQDTLAFIVKYQKVTKHNFEKRGNPRWDDFIATLPKETSAAFVLYYENNKALYSENPQEQEEVPRGLQRALMHQSMSSGNLPDPDLQQVFYDLNNMEKTKQLEFMTRSFIIKSEVETPAWKISNERKKILNYVCMSAVIIIDEKEYTAWFTPELPVSVGPDKFYGLPGLILAVENDSETLLLASSVEFMSPDKEILVKPKDGKKVTEDELEKIIEKKIEEQKKEMEARKKSNGKGMGRGRGPH